MSELEQFQKLFNECSMWRGGCERVVEDGKFPVLPIHFAVRLKNGKTDYIAVNIVFDREGKWIDTIKVG